MVFKYFRPVLNTCDFARLLIFSAFEVIHEIYSTETEQSGLTTAWAYG